MKKILKSIPFIVILLFLALYFAYQNGYYERILRDKTTITNIQIEQFEQDIKDGKDVSIEDYLEEKKDYSTKLGKTSLKVGDNLQKIINSGVKFIFKKISSIVE